MKRTSMLKPELEERSFGSAYDPLLNGVAEGLARLFPPVGGAAQAARPCESRRQDDRRQEDSRQESRRQENRRQEAQRSGEEKRGSHTRA